MQWTQEKLRHRADKRGKNMKKEDVVGHWDEKKGEKQQHGPVITRQPPPPTPHNPPQNLLASHPRLSAPLSS